MQPDIWRLYKLMLRSRLLEEGIAELWQAGMISGEMHLGTGEEAIMAGLVSQLQPEDALAGDHRSTAPFFMHGVDPRAIVRELLGRPDGLCRGMGGHMHLFDKAHLVASSGIVGSAGPAACGFALAAQHLRPGSVAVAFFGEGALNQGMLLESLNLALVWELPVIFVCKDDDWAITTRSRKMVREPVTARARGFGLPVADVDGREVLAVWEAAREAIERGRSGQGPSFIRARCVHLEGHFLGYQLLRLMRRPLKEMPRIALPLTKAFIQPRGGALAERLRGMKTVLSTVLHTLNDPRQSGGYDPLRLTRQRLLAEPERLKTLEAAVEAEMAHILADALGEEEGR